MLALTATSLGKEVIVSRGELVEIGGSFRVPDVISHGGAVLREVGTTNRSRVSDYEQVISEDSGAILIVHPSNFRIVGFTEKATRQELADLAQKSKIPLIEDLGSGLLVGDPKLAEREQLRQEEWVSKAIQEGVDLVCFSGDKLLGGPQAGIIVGKKELVERCRKHPLYRALRVCKMTLAALEATLQIYTEQRYAELPVWRMLECSASKLQDAALRIASRIPGASVEEDQSFSGGGAMPGQAIAGWSVVLRPPRLNAFAASLRQRDPAILLSVRKESLRIDPRTLLPGEEEEVVAAVNQLLSQ